MIVHPRRDDVSVAWLGLAEAAQGLAGQGKDTFSKHRVTFDPIPEVTVEASQGGTAAVVEFTADAASPADHAWVAEVPVLASTGPTDIDVVGIVAKVDDPGFQRFAFR